METESTVRVERGAEGAQSQFAVVARAHRFAHRGGAGGLQAGEQERRSSPARWERAWCSRWPASGAPSNGDGRVAVGEREPRAHGFERLANALHGPARKRCVADQREAALLRREQAGDHAHGRAGVAAVERLGSTASRGRPRR